MEGDREDAASRGNITDLFTISSPIQPEVSSVETPPQQTQFGSISHTAPRLDAASSLLGASATRRPTRPTLVRVKEFDASMT